MISRLENDMQKTLFGLNLIWRLQTHSNFKLCSWDWVTTAKLCIEINKMVVKAVDKVKLLGLFALMQSDLTCSSS